MRSLAQRAAANTKSAEEGKKIETQSKTVSRARNESHRVATQRAATRLTPADQLELDTWIDELQLMTKKKITSAKIFRGLIQMREQIDNKALIESIKENC